MAERRIVRRSTLAALTGYLALAGCSRPAGADAAPAAFLVFDQPGPVATPGDRLLRGRAKRAVAAAFEISMVDALTACDAGHVIVEQPTPGRGWAALARRPADVDRLLACLVAAMPDGMAFRVGERRDGTAVPPA